MIKQLEQCLIVEMCGKQVDRKYPTMYPACYTEGKARSISKKQKRYFSYSTNAQNDKIIRTKEILCFFTKAKNDKIEEADDKSIKNCDDKVTESKNDKSNHNRDISPSSI